MSASSEAEALVRIRGKDEDAGGGTMGTSVDEGAVEQRSARERIEREREER
jgi:hypothetical protein